MNDRIKVVVAGCGWGKNHMRAAVESEHADLAAIWSRTETKERLELAKSHNVPFYSDFEKMLEEMNPDVATIATPEATHRDLTVKALNAGAHVYCEKVLASSSKEAGEMVEAAEIAGKELNVGYNYRYSPSCRYMADQIASEAIGVPLFAMLRAFSCCVHHMTDYAGSILGKPTRVVSVIRDDAPGGESPKMPPVCFPDFLYSAKTAKSYMVQFESGATLLAAATDFSSADSSGATLLIEGTKGRIELDDLSGKVTIRKAEEPFSGDRIAQIYTPSQILDAIGLTENCVSAVKDFLGAVANGESAPIPAVEGVNMIALEEAIKESNEANAWMRVRL
jgi:predicted dehydrogenase